MCIDICVSDIGQQPADATVIHEDNQSAILLAKNHVCHSKIKHIDVRYHFVREEMQCGVSLSSMKN